MVKFGFVLLSIPKITLVARLIESQSSEASRCVSAKLASGLSFKGLLPHPANGYVCARFTVRHSWVAHVEDAGVLLYIYHPSVTVAKNLDLTPVCVASSAIEMPRVRIRATGGNLKVHVLPVAVSINAGVPDYRHAAIDEPDNDDG